MTSRARGKARSSWSPFWIVLGLTAILMVFETARSRRLAAHADESKVNAATGHGKTGAGKIGEGGEETATGIGHIVVEKVRDGAVSFGQSVKTFFTRLVPRREQHNGEHSRTT